MEAYRRWRKAEGEEEKEAVVEEEEEERSGPNNGPIPSYNTARYSKNKYKLVTVFYCIIKNGDCI